MDYSKRYKTVETRELPDKRLTLLNLTEEQFRSTASGINKASLV